MATRNRNGVSSEAEPEIRRFLRVMRQRRAIVSLCLLLGAVAYALWAVGSPRIYEATASVVVDRTPPQVLEVRDVVEIGPGQYFALEDYIQTQRRLLLSDMMARRVIARLKLEKDREFWSDGVPRSPAVALEELERAISVKTIIDTQLLVVSFRHRNPKQAKRVVDALVDCYIEAQAERRDAANLAASKWLADQVDQLRKRLAESERKLYEFKQRNDLVSVALDDRVNSVTQQIDKLAGALTDAKLVRIKRTLEATELVRTLESDPIVNQAGIGDEPIARYKRELFEEERKLSELQARYEDTHPLVLQQQARVDSVRKTLQREIAAVADNTYARMKAAGHEVQKIAAELEEAKREGLRTARLELEYNSLKRETDALSKQYLLVENRTKETELTAQLKENNLYVLDYARLPEQPVSPKLAVGAVVALLLSLIVGIGCAFGREALDRTVKTPDDIEKKLSMPVLGVLPRMQGDKWIEMSVADNPKGIGAELCRLIRTNLVFTEVNGPRRTIMVTGAIPREGRSLTSISLAITMARSGSRVLLIDGNLRHPRLKTAMGLRSGIGLTDVVLGNASLEASVQTAGVPNLYVLVAGSIPPNPAELVESPRFRELLAEWSARFDRVIVDAPALVPVTDAALLARCCDGVVMVLRAGRTTVDEALRARRNLTAVGATLLGAVLNDVEVDRSEYQYQDAREPEEPKVVAATR